MATKTDNAALANAANDSGAFKPLTVIASKPSKAKSKITKAADASKAARKAAKAKKPAKGKPAKKAKAKSAAPAQRADSKQARFIAAMRTAKGMSIEEAAKAFDWQKHTVRGAIAGAIKKRLGLKVDAEQDEKRGTVYRIKK
jgi:DNA-binding transcriptional regulator YiaG